MRDDTSSEPWRSTPSTRPRSRRCALLRRESASVNLEFPLTCQADHDLLRRFLPLGTLEDHFVLIRQRFRELLEDLRDRRDADQVLALAPGVLGELLERHVALGVLEGATLHRHRPELRAGLAEAVDNGLGFFAALLVAGLEVQRHDRAARTRPRGEIL